MEGAARNSRAGIFVFVIFGLVRLLEPYHRFPIRVPSVSSVFSEYLTMYCAILRYCPSVYRGSTWMPP